MHFIISDLLHSQKNDKLIKIECVMLFLSQLSVEVVLRSLCCILEQDTFTSQKVLVIPRKRWLHPDMTEKLLTGA